MTTAVSRIVIVDRYPLFRAGLRALLSGENDLAIVGEAGGGSEAIQMVQDMKPDLLVLDYACAGARTFTAEVLDQLRKSKPFRVLLVHDNTVERDLVQSLELGARGIVGRDSSVEATIKSIRSVLNGELWIDQKYAGRLVEILQNPASASRKKFDLTARQLEIIGTIVEGFTNREIGERFSISAQTVKHHLNSIFDKIGVSNRTELAAFAMHHNLSRKAPGEKANF